MLDAGAPADLAQGKRPSTRLSSLGGQATVLAGNRGTGPNHGAGPLSDRGVFGSGPSRRRPIEDAGRLVMGRQLPSSEVGEQRVAIGRGEVVPLCPFESDSRFNGPGLLQNQLKGKVDATVVGRNSDASRAPPGPTLMIERSIGSLFLVRHEFDPPRCHDDA